MELGLFRDGPYMALTLGGAAANTAAVMFLFVAPLTLQGQWDLSVVLAGTALLAPALAMAPAGPLAGRVPPRAAARIMAGCLCGAALVLACLAQTSSLTWYVAVAAGLGVGLAGAVTDQDRGVGSEAAADTALLITASGCLTACVVLAVWSSLREGMVRAGSGESER